jgi:hypothetical protein
MQREVIVPLIGYEVLINVYLLCLFILPLRQLYSYKTRANPQLRTIAWRSMWGTVLTLTASAINLTILTILDGEPGWLCLLICNLDGSGLDSGSAISANSFSFILHSHATLAYVKGRVYLFGILDSRGTYGPPTQQRDPEVSKHGEAGTV